jgi:methoxymalonate biosynthesis acyl carrier protein
MQTDTTRTQLREFVERRFAGIELTDDLDIFSLGFANSLFSMELVLFIEQLTGQEVPSAELSLDNFRTIDAMTALADRLTATGTQQPAVPQQAASDMRQPAELG